LGLGSRLLLGRNRRRHGSTICGGKDRDLVFGGDGFEVVGKEVVIGSTTELVVVHVARELRASTGKERDWGLAVD
jgi:hypothetical protein